MLFDHICYNCQSLSLKRSSIHNPLEALLSPLITVYRCKSCQVRQLKFRTVKIGLKRPHDKVSYGMRMRRQ